MKSVSSTHQSRSAPARSSSPKAHRRKRAQRQQRAMAQVRRFEAALSRSLVLPRLPQLRLPSLLGSGFHPSKLASLAVLILASGALYWLQDNADFFVYREKVQFAHTTYLSGDELYAMTDLEGLSVFWVKPQEVAQQVRRHPYVADSSASVLLPASVTVSVAEAQPVALWVTDSGTLWLLADGRALPARGESPAHLMRIIDGPQEARAIRPGDQDAIDLDILRAAMALVQHMPGLNSVRYNSGPGLYFSLPDTSTLVYWGDGLNLEKKLQNLATIQSTLVAQRKSAERIDVRFVEKPFYK